MNETSFEVQGPRTPYGWLDRFWRYAETLREGWQEKPLTLRWGRRRAKNELRMTLPRFIVVGRPNGVGFFVTYESLGSPLTVGPQAATLFFEQTPHWRERLGLVA